MLSSYKYLSVNYASKRHTNCGEPVPMASGFGTEGSGLIPDATKVPPSAAGVCVPKIRGSGSPVVGH